MTEVYRNYVAGQWVDCKSRKTFPNTNPANTAETLGHFPASGAEDAQAACEAAAKAQPAWAAAPAPRRGEFLFKAAELLESRLQKVSEEMTREEGKTLPEAKGEVKRAINILRYFGGEGARQFSYQIPSEREKVFATRCGSRWEWWRSSLPGISPAPFPPGKWPRRSWPGTPW